VVHKAGRNYADVGIKDNILWTIAITKNHSVLLIIISSEEVAITESYHKFLGLTRIGDNMAVS